MATPPASKAHDRVGILYLPDIIGIWQNSQLMADAFASEGYICLVLDLFNGDPAPLNMPDGFDIMGWLAKGSSGDNPHTKEFIDPVILSGLKFLRDSGVSRIGAVGYCFGAKVSGLLEQKGTTEAKYVSTSSAITKTASSADSLHTRRSLSRRSSLP